MRRIKLILLLFLFLVSIGGCGNEYPPQDPTYEKVFINELDWVKPDDFKTLAEKLEQGIPQTIVTYGTSLTCGSWVDLLGEELEKKYPGLVTIHNECIGGMSSVTGVECINLVLSLLPDVVFIEWSMNDAFKGGWYDVSLQESYTNLLWMTNEILKDNPYCEIIIQTMNPCTGTGAYWRPDLEAYYQVYRDFAKDWDFSLIDNYPNWKEVLDKDPYLFSVYVPDGVHPEAEGYSKIVIPFMLKSLNLKLTDYN